ncbi:hypothetical protein BU17DRAFT_94061 [Hysterangium stoloniferum]|nr:hypothetical protein BU17DRAFT_94061 [Hysterangium stoloniferum]
MSTLPFQVEELIASFNTSHINNEAIELAKLQTQLKQALQSYPQGGPFPTSPVQTAHIHQGAAPLNTPVARTPSGPVWGHQSDVAPGRRRRSSSVVSAGSARSRGRQMSGDAEHHSMYDMEQDVMEEVEEAEVDASLYSNSASSPTQFTNQPHVPSSLYACSPTTYAYALTDPFLTHQLQVADQMNRQPSFFAQLATSQQQNSPFYSAPHQPQPPTSQPPYQAQRQPSQHPRHLTIDTSQHTF